MNFGFGSGVNWDKLLGDIPSPVLWSYTPFDPPAGPQLPPQGLVLPRVTRLELIHNGGRQVVNWHVGNVQLHLQDDERTLKIFYTTKEEA